MTGTLQDNVQGSFEADNKQNWSVQVTVQDLFDSTTYTLSLGRGSPIVFYDVDKSSVGINTFPSHDNSLEGLDIYMNQVGIMGLKAVLTSEEDLNDITEQGIYYQPYNFYATTAHNYPVPYTGYLETFNVQDALPHAAAIIQKYSACREINNIQPPAVYYRASWRGSWSAWTPEHDYHGSGETGTGEGIVHNVGRLQICTLNTRKTNIAINAAYGPLYLGFYTWTFPKPFAETPSVQCGMFRWGTAASWGVVREATSSNATFYGFDAVKRASGEDVLIQATAIGLSVV